MSDVKKIVDGGKKYLNASDIIAVKDISPIEVEIPEWGGTVLIRPMSAMEALVYGDMFKKNEKEAMVRLVIASVVDTDGQALFTFDDVAKLQQKSLRALMRIQDAALVLNGLKDAEAAKEKAKNG